MMDVSLWDSALLALQSRADTWFVAVGALKGLSIALWLLVGASVVHLWVGPRSVASH